MDLKMCMNACDGGILLLETTTGLKIVESTDRFKNTFGDVNSLEELLTDYDLKTFYNNFKQNNLFSVRCIFNSVKRSLHMPVSLKCLNMGNQTYCLVTLQTDWYDLAKDAIDKRIALDSLVANSGAIIIETDMNYNINSCTSKASELFDIKRGDNMRITFMNRGWKVADQDFFNVPSNLIFERENVIRNKDDVYFIKLCSVENRRAGNICGINISMHLNPTYIQESTHKRSIVDPLTGAYTTDFFRAKSVIELFKQHNVQMIGIKPSTATAPLPDIVRCIRSLVSAKTPVVVSGNSIYLVNITNITKDVLTIVVDTFQSQTLKCVIVNNCQLPWEDLEQDLEVYLTDAIASVGDSIVEY